MCKYTDDLLNQVWEKAKAIDGYDPALYRKDCCGAWIKFNEYNNRDSDFGWEIDHIYPESLLKKAGASQEEIDDLCNLRPMNWRNNLTKAADYPIYFAQITSKDNKNIVQQEQYEVNKDTQEMLKKFYSKYYHD